jgi:hypothetical protein
VDATAPRCASFRHFALPGVRIPMRFTPLGDRRRHAGARTQSDRPTRGSPGVDAVRDGAVPDRGDADGLLSIVELVNDAVAPHAKRPEPRQAAAKAMAGERLAFKQAECGLDGVDERPAKLE